MSSILNPALVVFERDDQARREPLRVPFAFAWELHFSTHYLRERKFC